MSIIDPEFCDFTKNPLMKAALEAVEEREEENVIATAKKLIEEGERTSIQMCVNLENFMEVWQTKYGTRKFHLIPKYTASLRWQYMEETGR